jgi:hypothetical protein
MFFKEEEERWRNQYHFKSYFHHISHSPHSLTGLCCAPLPLAYLFLSEHIGRERERHTCPASATVFVSITDDRADTRRSSSTHVKLAQIQFAFSYSCVPFLLYISSSSSSSILLLHRSSYFLDSLSRPLCRSFEGQPGPVVSTGLNSIFEIDDRSLVPIAWVLFRSLSMCYSILLFHFIFISFFISVKWAECVECAPKSLFFFLFFSLLRPATLGRIKVRRVALLDAAPSLNILDTLK